MPKAMAEKKERNKLNKPKLQNKKKNQEMKIRISNNNQKI